MRHVIYNRVGVRGMAEWHIQWLLTSALSSVPAPKTTGTALVTWFLILGSLKISLGYQKEFRSWDVVSRALCALNSAPLNTLGIFHELPAVHCCSISVDCLLVKVTSFPDP